MTASETGANGTPVHVTPELLSQLAIECNLSDEARDAIEQALTVFRWSFDMVIDGLVNHRGRVHEERTDIPRPPAPEGSLVPFIAARMSLGVLTTPNGHQ